jgi:hypothetical protein
MWVFDILSDRFMEAPMQHCDAVMHVPKVAQARTPPKPLIEGRFWLSDLIIPHYIHAHSRSFSPLTGHSLSHRI